MDLVLLYQSATPKAPPPRDFDTGVVWRTLRDLGESFLSQLPYIVIGVIVFGVFLIVARIVKTAVHAAGERTRLDLTLADLLGRRASFAIVILGLFVAAVIIFPAFKPGDLIAGLGITSVAIGFALQGRAAELLRRHPHTVAPPLCRGRPNQDEGVRRHGRRD